MRNKIISRKSNGLAAAIIFVMCSMMTSGCFFAFEEIRGSGDVVREERQVRNFSGVKVCNQGDLKIELGDKEQLIIEAEDNLMEYIDTWVEDGVLKIGTKRNINLRNKKAIRYYLTAKSLDYLGVSSSGSITAPKMKADDFSVRISSSGDIKVDAIEAESVSVGVSSSGEVYIGELNADELSVRISSSGDIEIDEGRVKEQTVHISSSGHYDGRDVESLSADVKISSSGNARIWAKDYLDADLSSSGDLYYRGDPEKFSQRESSSGKVRRLR